MTDVVWLASYPKSGNTWLRVLIGCLTLRDGDGVDINDLPAQGGMASTREPFDSHLLIDSGLLTHDEIDCLRPRLHEALAQPGEAVTPDAGLVGRFVKTHDAYTLTRLGEPLLAGARGAKGAVVIVRDPRDIVASLANHNRSTLDEAIAFMGNPEAAFCGGSYHQALQLRQQLPRWSGHVAGWLEQDDIPVHLLRYEDMQRDAVAALLGVMRFAGRPQPREAVERAVERAAFANLQAQESSAGFSEWQDRGGTGRKFFRRGQSGGWREELTAEQVARVESTHGSMMMRLGYIPATHAALTMSDGRMQ